MNYNEISKKQNEPVEPKLEPATETEETCEACQINYPETEAEETCAECQINYPETEPEATKEAFGVVAGCAKLNIREEPSIDAKIVAVVTKGSVLEIDAENCDGEWFGVCTASGIQGFCMADYVDIKD